MIIFLNPEAKYVKITTLFLPHDGIRKIYIVRHSERIDEVAELSLSWNTFIAKAQTTRNKFDLGNDPMITEHGKSIAAQAAETLDAILRGNPHIEIIYSSKLRRCVETAQKIAQQLRVPICVCKGLALTAAAVKSRGSSFEFHTMEELQSFCPDTPLIDGDDPLSSYFVPSVEETGCRLDWLTSLDAIKRKSITSVVVAHRETIRNLTGRAPGGRTMSTPYCCIAEFWSHDAHPRFFNFLKILDSDGSVVFTKDTGGHELIAHNPDERKSSILDSDERSRLDDVVFTVASCTTDDCDISIN